MRLKIKWILAFLLLLGVIYGTYTLSCYVTSGNIGKMKVDVILDIGHGGDDPGKIGVNKALEKDLNLEIGGRVKKLLEKDGWGVLMTRETDESLADGGEESQKVADMKARVALINETKPSLTVSIHQNSYPSESIHGAQVFYYRHSEKGKQIASVLQEALRKMDSENHREAKENDTYYLLKRTEVPTVIVECGFLSNWEEAEKLTTEEYQEKVAEAIFEGIVECLKE